VLVLIDFLLFCVFILRVDGLEAQPPHMGGELKAGKEEHQNAAVPTLNSLAHSESLMCQL